jgi:hypothetical protein
MFKDNIKVSLELFKLAYETIRNTLKVIASYTTTLERQWLTEIGNMYHSRYRQVGNIRDNKIKNSAEYEDIAKKHMDKAASLQVAAFAQIERIRNEVTLATNSASSDVNFKKRILLRKWDKLHLIMLQADEVWKKPVEDVDRKHKRTER